MKAHLRIQPPDDAALPPALAARLDEWIAQGVARAAPLGTSDIRKGVQALSSIYVEGRFRGAIGARATGGTARRAALATYYAALHFLTTHAAVRALPPGTLGAPRRLLDAGCGTGAAGAGVALALASAPRLLGLDRSGWALGEARRTWAAFGLRGRTRRGALPAALPPTGQGDLLVLGWMLNECDAAAREGVLAALERGLDRGAHLLLLEPLSGRVSPWWDAAAQRLAPRGVVAAELRASPGRPAWIAHMDDAAGLDHRELGARVLAGPGR